MFMKCDCPHGEASALCVHCLQLAAYGKQQEIATLTAKVERYEKVLRGISGDARCVNDRCACCDVHSKIARVALSEPLPPSSEKDAKPKVLDYMPCVCARKPAHKNASECVSGGPFTATSGEEKK